jgi:O-methyltransferase involved in polyketide biosynthesis
MKLTGVSETLLIPLYARFKETQRSDGFIDDPKAIELVNNIDYDFEKLTTTKYWKFTEFGIALRVDILDILAKIFLQNNPDAVVVNLGAGLCTRFFRINNGKVKWFELDLKEVSQFWHKLIGETERHKFLTYSVFDYSWMEEFNTLKNKPILFIIEGLLTYFSSTEVKNLILKIQKNFPGAHMIVDALSPASLKKSAGGLKGFNAEFKWGIDSFKEMEKWDKKIRLVTEWSHLDLHQDRWGTMKYLRYLPNARSYFPKTAHLKFLPD